MSTQQNHNKPSHTGEPRGGGMSPHIAGEKAKNFKSTFANFMNYIGKFKLLILIVCFLSILSAVFAIIGPKVLSTITTSLYGSFINQTSIDFSFIRQTAIILVCLYLFSAFCSYAQGIIMSSVAMKITYKMREDISIKLNKLPLKYFDNTTHGDILSRITNDIDTVSQTLNQSLNQILSSVATVIGVLVMMISISIPMTIATMVIVPIAGGLIMLVVKNSQKFFRQQQEYLGKLNGQIDENYAGHDVVQAYNGEQDAIETFKQTNEKLYKSAWISQFLSGMMMPVMSFVGNLGYVIVCVFGGYLALIGAIAVGDIQAFLQYVQNFTQPIAQIANITNVLQQAAAAAERVFEFLDEEEQLPETTNPKSTENVQGIVEFKDVHFGYSSDKIIINNFSATIKAGQSIAIVGPTGAGKSTIIKLLMRFYELNSGQILIDGNDITDYTRQDLRALFGMVLQDTWLSNASIMENIRYGSFDKTDAQVIEAAKAAQCDEFIHMLPNSYDMILNEEASNISQGQKQLLTIARTILSDPKLLILDEATSSVDTRTEKIIQTAMKNLMKGRTSFVIAHRLSTIRDADCILFLKDGDVVEQGNHEELLAKQGAYAELYMSQFAPK